MVWGFRGTAGGWVLVTFVGLRVLGSVGSVTSRFWFLGGLI